MNSIRLSRSRDDRDDADALLRWELEDDELAAVLAGLRLLQNHLKEPGIEELGVVADILTNGGTLEPLSVEEINALCERLNSGEGEPDEDDEA